MDIAAWHRFWQATGYGAAADARDFVLFSAACCCDRSALARRRFSSMRRTCSGVMGDLAAVFGAGRGGVLGLSVSAMLYVLVEGEDEK